MGAGHQVGRFKVSLGLEEIEGRVRDTEIERHTNKETERQS